MVGKKLISCFCQVKDELVIQFADGQQEYFVQIIMRSELSMIRVISEFSRARKNSITLFPEIGQPVVNEVYCFENERCIYLGLSSGWSLLIKLFGNQSNVILCSNGKPSDIFKKKLTSDMRLSLDGLNRKFIVNWEQFEILGGDFHKMLPTLGGTVSKYIKNAGYQSLNLDEKWELINNVLKQLNEPEFYIYLEEGKPFFTLFAVENALYHGSDVIEALNKFYLQFMRVRNLADERKLLMRILHKKRKRAEAGVLKSKKRLDQIETLTGHKKIADIIMANMHNIPAGAAQIELTDFYTGNQILIKLKPTLSPQKNAAQYYRKSKNQQKEIKVLNLNLRRNKQQLETINEQVAFVEECNDLKILRGYSKVHGLVEASKTTEPQSLFKKFEFQNFIILVGKNATNNDLLTQKFTHKDDLWLHAKDVKGSHVVIKQIPGRSFPTSVVEKAAQLAAFYSKRKNDSLCPVMYTPKKYVRKPKGAHAGQVIIEREEVILVVPEAWTTPQ